MVLSRRAEVSSGETVMWKTREEIESFATDYQLWYKSSKLNAITLGADFFADNKFIPIDTGYCKAEATIYKGERQIQAIDSEDLEKTESYYQIALRAEAKELEKLDFVEFIPYNCATFQLKGKPKNVIKGLISMGTVEFRGFNGVHLDTFASYAFASQISNFQLSLCNDMLIDNYYLLSSNYTFSYTVMKTIAGALQYIETLSNVKADNIYLYSVIDHADISDPEALENKIRYDIIKVKNCIYSENINLSYFVLSDGVNIFKDRKVDVGSADVSLIGVNSTDRFLVDNMIRENCLYKLEQRNLEYVVK